MVDARVQEFFDWLVVRLLEGELDWLEDVYVYPMALFIGDEIRVENGPEDTALYLEMRRAHAAQLGVYAMTANVLQVTHKTTGHRFSAHVEYTFLRDNGSEIGRNKSHYRCHFEDEVRIRVESIEILELGLPRLSSIVKARRH